MTTPDQPPSYTPPPSGGFFDQLGRSAGQLGKLAQATGTAAAGATSGGYSFDADQLVSIAKKWEELADSLDDGLRDADVIAGTQGPGAEYASVGNAEKIRGTGEALKATLAARRDYCKAQAEKFRAAVGKYGEAEAQTQDHIEKQGGTL